MIELYTHPMSPCAQKVRITLAEKNLSWVSHHVDLAAKENLTADYLKLNPLGVVPTLVHDGKLVIESSIICEFLDDLSPNPPLRPAGAHERARMRLWMKHVDNKLHPACGALQWPMVMRPALMEKSEAERQELLKRIPEAPRRERQKRLAAMGLDAPDVADAARTYRKTASDMEKILRETRWMAGDAFSLADICLAPYFQTLKQFGWLSLMTQDCPRVGEWYAACQSRPSYKSAVADDFPEALSAKLLSDGEKALEKIASHL